MSVTVIPTPETTPNAPARPSRRGNLWREWVRPMLVVLVVVMGFRSMVLDWNIVPSGSMRPTILDGDYILVNKLAYDLRVPFLGHTLFTLRDPQRGDVVVFVPPGETDRFVKRIIGVPGDLIELRDNQLFVNGVPALYAPLDPAVVRDIPSGLHAGDEFLRESVAGKGHAVARHEHGSGMDTFGPVRVPEGHYFVLGDNRDDSRDSRSFGLVARGRISGRASHVAASFDPWHGNRPRWTRFLLGLV